MKRFILIVILLFAGNSYADTIWLGDSENFDGDHRAYSNLTIVVMGKGSFVRNAILNDSVADEGYGVIHVTADDVTVSGVTINNGNGYHGIYLKGNGNKAIGNTLNGGEYRSAGITVGDPSQWVTIERNRCHRVNMTGAVKGDGHCVGIAGGIEESRPIKNVRIANNTIQYSGETITNYQICVYNSENVQVLNNRIMMNYSPSIDIGTNSKNVTVYGNLIFGNKVNQHIDPAHGLILVDQSSGGCPSCDTLEDVSIVNNYIAYNSGAKSALHFTRISTQNFINVTQHGNTFIRNGFQDIYTNPLVNLD